MERKCWSFYTMFNNTSIRVYYTTWYGIHPERSKIYKELNKNLNNNYGHTVNGRKLTGIGYTDDPEQVDDYTSDRYVIPK